MYPGCSSRPSVKHFGQIISDRESVFTSDGDLKDIHYV